MLRLINQHLEEVLITILLVMMSVLIGLQVFMRYVMGDSLTWSEELARYCFIWCTYLGVSYGVKLHAHISVEAVVHRFSPTIQRWVRLVVYAVFIVFAVLVVKEGYALSLKIFGFGQTSSSLGIPMGYIYLAPTVGFALVIFRLLQNMFYEVTAKGDSK